MTERASDPAPASAPSTTTEPTPGVATTAQTKPSAARACPKRLAPGEHPRPSVEHRPDIEKLIEEGRAGAPRRVTLKFHNPIAACVCTDFVWDDTWPESHERNVSSETHLIFPEPIPNGYTHTEIRYHGATDYEITGYFSGREVDWYEFYRLQWGRELSGGDDEQRGSWPTKRPEFCVESWCFNPDPNPTSTWPIDPPQKHATEYAKHLAAMRAAGVPLCSAR